jgi:monoamine oxidase
MTKQYKHPILRLFRKTVANEYYQTTGSNGLSRKDFLVNTGKTALALGLSSSILNACAPAKKGNGSTRVAIIGGGIAGLHAGHILKKQGIDFTIFEGSSRLGGRIFTAKDQLGNGLTTELGGEFIDSNHTDMINLANEFGLKLYDLEADVQNGQLIKDTYFFDGRHYTEKELITEFSKFSEKIAADVKLVVEDEDEAAFEKYDAISIVQYLNDLGIKGWLFNMLSFAYTSEYGMDAGEQSALNLIYMLDPKTSSGFRVFGDSDERYKIIGGNSLLIEKMQDLLKDNIRTEHYLTTLEAQKDKYLLNFKDGTQVESAYVILAIPFSLLRLVELKVSLPEEKKKAIQELGYGTSSKIIFGFNDRVWRSQKYSGYLFNNVIHNGWDSSVGQNNNSGPGSYTIFLGGKEAKEIKEENAQSYLNQLDKIFPGTAATYNSKKAVFNWASSPISLGGYASYKVGQWSIISGHEKTPVGNIYFAGEHCSEDFQGYMNGGAETGRIAAEGIINNLTKAKPQDKKP